MENNPIKCQKYNYSLDAAIQKYSSFNATLSISGDGESIVITNIRLNEKFNKPQYI